MQRGQKRTNHELSLGKSSFHNRRGGNTIRDMFSFCQLWGWMLRFGVTHTHRHWARQFPASPSEPPHPHPETTASYPVRPAAIFFYISGAVLHPRASSDTKVHWALWNQAWESSGEETLLCVHTQRKASETSNQQGFEVKASMPTATNLIHNQIQTLKFQV